MPCTIKPQTILFSADQEIIIEPCANGGCVMTLRDRRIEHRFTFSATGDLISIPLQRFLQTDIETVPAGAAANGAPSRSD